jgi:hypothetical protein
LLLLPLCRNCVFLAPNGYKTLQVVVLQKSRETIENTGVSWVYMLRVVICKNGENLILF